jgi:benzoyl-CoA reductase/2-hydroxyglutaryl-CoA dehydratase subunit BcrC/BadD/HgdB
LLSATREALSSRGFAEALDHFQRTGDLQLAPREGAAQDGVRLALVGSPLHAEHFALMDFLEENGARVALDATGSGERALPAEFDPQRLAADPFAELVNAYFGRLPSAFRRPNEQLYDWLGQKLAERRVQGIIFLHYAWCDTWQAEAQRMKEWTETPLLVIGGIDDELMTSHASGRIQAFLEMLK